jgi:hypothetical protein
MDQRAEIIAVMHTAGEITLADGDRQSVRYGLLLSFKSTEDAKAAMKAQRVAFSVFG